MIDWRRRVSTILVALTVSGVVSGCESVLTATPALPGGASSPALSTDPAPALSFPDTSEAPQEIPAEDPIALEAREIVATWSLDQQIASLFLVHVPGQALDDFAELRAAFPVAGFLVLRDNVNQDSQRAREFLSSLRELDDPALLVAVDQEGGEVERLRGDDLPAAPELGEGDPARTTAVTRQRNILVRDAGANLNFGIVADVSPGQGSYIDARSFGESPDRVARHVEAAMAGAVDGVALAVKHFPGHGLTDLDTHQDLAVSAADDAGWRSDHLPPFEAAIESGAPVVMLSHIVVTQKEAVPASISSQWVSVLRGELKFDGVIATDDLSMLEETGESEYQDFASNAEGALVAGVDLVVDAGASDSGTVGERLEGARAAVRDAVASGEITAEEIQSAAVRVLALRLSLG